MSLKTFDGLADVLLLKLRIEVAVVLDERRELLRHFPQLSGEFAHGRLALQLHALATTVPVPLHTPQHHLPKGKTPLLAVADADDVLPTPRSAGVAARDRANEAGDDPLHRRGLADSLPVDGLAPWLGGTSNVAGRIGIRNSSNTPCKLGMYLRIVSSTQPSPAAVTTSTWPMLCEVRNTNSAIRACSAKASASASPPQDVGQSVSSQSKMTMVSPLSPWRKHVAVSDRATSARGASLCSELPSLAWAPEPS
eukprot:CAMPEP_0176213524 /NCGR_PEP_ID=MMETSP0121_2-20121125/15703_1 /TAXON_ID=160619 /ORGANISM="Kryptoperidinium foliaceum, Strain CCMP 1326" /LENGTH=251 /DNA_ID=CAMNT_0017552589 /DNA_START=308 /DNA_END=1061 /DNA_ORIENTATION=-